MKWLVYLFHIVWKTLWYGFAVAVVLTAALFSIARLLLPTLGDYSVSVENYFSQYVNQPIKIQSLDAEWRGLGPSLVLNNVRLLDTHGQDTVVRIAKVHLGLGFWETLTAGRLGFSTVDLQGVDLSLIRQKDGRISLAGFEMLKSMGEEVADDTFLRQWLLQQGRIGVQFRNLLYLDRMADDRKYSFSDVSLSLRNQGERHLIEGWIGIPKQSDQKMTILVDARGDLLQTDQWSGKIYVSGKKINIINLISSLTPVAQKFTVGPSDFELWSDWNKAKLQKLQGRFAFRDLTGNKAVNDAVSGAMNLQNVVQYQQFDGRFRWERQNTGWRLQADNVVIKNQNRVWPASQINVTYRSMNHQQPSAVSDNGVPSTDRRGRNIVKAAVTSATEPNVNGASGFEYTVSSNFIRTQDLSPLLKLFDIDSSASVDRPDTADTGSDFMNIVQHTDIGMDLRDLNLRYGSKDNAFELSADVSDLHAKPYKQFPGVKNLSGRLHANQHDGHIMVDSKNALLDMPQLFRQNIVLNELQGEVGWRTDDKAVFVTGRNLHLRESGFTSDMLLDMEIPISAPVTQQNPQSNSQNNSQANSQANSQNKPDEVDGENPPSPRKQGPYINFIAQFAGADGSKITRKLPATIMSPGAVAWLDRAIVGGTVSSGNVVFNGNVKDFPFRNGDGVFKARLDVQHATLDYGEHWPRLENINAKMEFDGSGVTIKSNSATISQSKVSNTLVTVADLNSKPLLINIKGDVNGATQDKVRYLLQSPPLRRKFGQFFEDVEASGDSKLHVDVDLSVKKGDVNAEVNGYLQLAQNTIRYLWFGEALTAVNGTINILPHGIQAQRIKADFYNQPTTIDIKTLANPKTKESENIQVIGNGNFDSRDLSRRYLPVLTDLVSGKTDWTVVTNIPLEDENSSVGAKRKPISFTAESYLRGVEVRLPTPFDKRPEQAFHTTIRGSLFTGSKYQYRVNYGNRLEGIMEYSEVGEDAWRGEVRFGNGPVELPNERGFRLVGHLQDMSVDVWQSLISQIDDKRTEAAKTDSGEKAPIDWSAYFNSANLSIDRFQLFGQEAKNMLLTIKNQGQTLLLDVNSDELKGQINIPYDFTHNPLVLNLDRWELTSVNEGGGSTIDPRELPAIKVYAKSVSFKNRKFGSVKLETTKIVEGLRLEQLVVKPRSTTILATGKWTSMAGEQKSEFQLHLESKNLGDTMDDLDYVGSISGGEGNIDANISWPGPLTDVDIARLQGDVAIHFKRGKLLAIDSGAGRIFGLFSLQTLPKRLLLDFSDLYEKGIVFNTISGNFTIEDGDAYTNNFYMAGPAAKAQVAGRIGLATQDYDQLLTFTPQSADIASLIGLLIGTPWGFVIPQIFREDINKAMSFQYTLAGTWSSPQLEPVIKPEPFDLTK